MVAPRGISDTRGLTNLKIGSDVGRSVMSVTHCKEIIIYFSYNVCENKIEPV